MNELNTDKQTFANFIAAKRKAIGLTQKELADKLFVTHTAVSKWERGLSYPDITLVADICTILNISEHEFITASNDTESRKIAVQANRYKVISKTTRWCLNSAYLIALLTCFIVNFATSGGLDWFYIVLSGIAVAASITTLPVYLKSHKLLISSVVTSSLILVLLLTIFGLSDIWHEFWKAVVLYAVPLLGYWLCYVCCRFLPMKRIFKVALCFLVLSVVGTVVLYFSESLFGGSINLCGNNQPCLLAG